MKPDEPEEVIIACLPLSFGNQGGFDDDVYGKCGECGTPIRWRPHSPVGRRLCAPCVVNSLEPGDRIAVTRRTAEDVVAWAASQKAAAELKNGGVG